MTKINIISGFLGAGKTTLIKKLLKEVYVGEKVVLIENEFGEIGIDGGFLREAGIQMKEMNSGCICCSLVGDFGEALEEVLETYEPDRILIEPSGVGKLSDVKAAVEAVAQKLPIRIAGMTTVVDAGKCSMYAKNFGEFFLNQIEHADSLVLSRTDVLKEEKVEKCIAFLRQYNKAAVLVATPWEQIEGSTLRQAIEEHKSVEEYQRELQQEVVAEQECHCGEHHEHHHEEHRCECGHEHHEDHSCGCGHEHHEDHSCGCGHEHHEEHTCNCGHDHHHAEEVFMSWGVETTKNYARKDLESFLAELEEEKKYGMVLRAKGIVAGEEGKWLHFDYVPGEAVIREGSAEIIGKLCVIGSKLQEDALARMFLQKA